MRYGVLGQMIGDLVLILHTSYTDVTATEPTNPQNLRTDCDRARRRISPAAVYLPASVLFMSDPILEVVQ